MDAKPTVLLAEDEENDVFMMQRAIRKLDSPVLLQVAKDGKEAIDYLAGEGAYANRELHPVPALILLDIKMPRKDGFAVLEWLKQDTLLPRIPVVMVTSSNLTADVEKALGLGASAYLVKPVSSAELQSLFTAITNFAAYNPERPGGN
jgi:CheY-like chemotaxis protein